MPHEFAAEHIELIRQLPLTAIIGQNEPQNWSRAYWLRYFWQEAVTVKSAFHAHARGILPFFNAVFKLPYSWDEGYDDQFDRDGLIKQGTVWNYRQNDERSMQWRVRHLAPRMGGSTIESCPPVVFREFLEGLLEAGFKRIPVTVDGLNEVQDSTKSVLFNSVRLQNDTNTKTFQCSFGWRGDSRDFAALDAAGGFRARADSIVNGFAARCNLREEWHPFSLLANRSDYWYRQGQEDNCLHTAVSIATDFRTATVFPLLENKLAGKKIPKTEAEANQQSTPNAGFCKIRTDPAIDGISYRYADRVQLYLVLLNGSGFNTQAVQQEKFPELAVKFVDASSLLASITFTRLFHGLSGDDGFTALYNRALSVPPTLERCRAAINDADLANKLLAEVTRVFNNTVATMPYSAKWIPAGSEPVPAYKPAGSQCTIQRVTRLNAEVLWP